MTNLPSQGDPQIAVAVVGLQSGSRYRSGCRASRWQYGAGEAYERIGVDYDHVSRDRGRLPTAGRAYRHSDENGSATASVSART